MQNKRCGVNVSIDTLCTNQHRNGVAEWKGGVDHAVEICRCHQLKHGEWTPTYTLQYNDFNWLLVRQLTTTMVHWRIRHRLIWDLHTRSLLTLSISHHPRVLDSHFEIDSSQCLVQLTPVSRARSRSEPGVGAGCDSRTMQISNITDAISMFIHITH